MVVDTKTPESADLIFHALSDATRRDILLRCLEGEYSVSTLASYYPMSFAAVQKHVAVLEKAHLVTKRRRGREQMETMWRSRLDRMGQILRETTTQGGVP